MKTGAARVMAFAQTANSKPVRVDHKSTDAAINAAMKRKGITMDCSAWKRRAQETRP